MWILIISLIALAVVAAIAGTVRNRRLQKKIDNGELDAMPEVQEVDAECCGQHEVCEKESLLAAVSKKIEYYDDEELDKYIGTAPDEYTPEQEDEFRDVFYTMQSEDSGRVGAQPATARHCTARQYKRRSIPDCRRKKK